MKTNDILYRKPVTNHAKQRITERTEIPIKKINKLSKHIYKYGYKIRRFTGEFYDYLLTKQLDGANYSLRVYENNIYIFDSYLSRLVTVYPIPEEFIPISNYINVDSSPCIISIRFPDNHYEYVLQEEVLTEDIGLATEFRTKQKATNYIKNNRTLSVLKKRGCEINIICG